MALFLTGLAARLLRGSLLLSLLGRGRGVKADLQLLRHGDAYFDELIGLPEPLLDHLGEEHSTLILLSLLSLRIQEVELSKLLRVAHFSSKNGKRNIDTIVFSMQNRPSLGLGIADFVFLLSQRCFAKASLPSVESDKRTRYLQSFLSDLTNTKFYLSPGSRRRPCPLERQLLVQ